jgi:hypothetical protein
MGGSWGAETPGTKYRRKCIRTARRKKNESGHTASPARTGRPRKGKDIQVARPRRAQSSVVHIGGGMRGAREPGGPNWAVWSPGPRQLLRQDSHSGADAVSMRDAWRLLTTATRLSMLEKQRMRTRAVPAPGKAPFDVLTVLTAIPKDLQGL